MTLQLTLEASLVGHTDWVTTVAPSPTKNNQFITGSRDKTLIYWELDDVDHTGSPGLSQVNYTVKRRLYGHSHFVSEVVLSIDGNYALSSSWDKGLRFWDIQNNECLQTFNGHTKDVLTMAISHDNRQIISSGREPTIKLWNVLGECKQVYGDRKKTGKSLRHTDWISCVRFIPDPANADKGDDQKMIRAISASWDKTVKIWNFHTGEVECTFRGHHGNINSLCCSPDGSLCASGGKDGKAMLWDLNDNKHLYTLEANDNINQLTFSPNRYWLCGAVGNTIKVWDLENKQIVDEAKVTACDGTKGTKDPQVMCLAWLSDGQRLVAGYTDNVVRIFRVTTMAGVAE